MEEQLLVAAKLQAGECRLRQCDASGNFLQAT
jgi:hypothetical protein